MNLWIKELLRNLDKNLDETKKVAIMEACGEKCPFTHLPDEKLLEIKKNSTDEGQFIKQLSEKWRVKVEDNKIYVVFDKCYCPLVKEDINGASATLCYCTQGNIKKKFRLGLGREVIKKKKKTILAGDKECRFQVLI